MELCKMGGRGRSSGSPAASGGSSRAIPVEQKTINDTEPEKLPDGRIKGVEYLNEPYPRSPGHGEYTPLVSPSGLNKMAKDMRDAGVKAPMATATDDERRAIAQRMNKMERSKRARLLRESTAAYLKQKTGSAPTDRAVEHQLNRWGLSGEESRSYYPRE